MVSEYTHTSLSAGQQSALVEAFGLLTKRQHNGISVGTVLLVNEERVAGMARCARSTLSAIRYVYSVCLQPRQGSLWNLHLCKAQQGPRLAVCVA